MDLTACGLGHCEAFVVCDFGSLSRVKLRRWGDTTGFEH
jgi:hypothetical protein